VTDPASTSSLHGRTASPLPPSTVHHRPPSIIILFLLIVVVALAVHPIHNVAPPEATPFTLLSSLVRFRTISDTLLFTFAVARSPLPHVSHQRSSVQNLRLVLGNARRIMYAISSHVYNGNNLPPYNIHHTKGHQLAQHSPNPPHHPPLPPPSQRSASSIPKEPIVVVGIPSVSIQSNRLVVGNAQTSQSISPRLVLESQFTLFRLYPFLHSSQSTGRRFLWHCMVM